jgi:hypothetical protein
MRDTRSAWVILCLAGWAAFTITVILFLSRGGTRPPSTETRARPKGEHAPPQASSYEPVGPGFTAVVEEIDSDEQGAPEGRILFFSHRTLGMRATLQTGYPTYVVPSWSANRFLVAWNVPTTEKDGDKTRIVEFDPEAKAVVSEYVHPRGLPVLSLPGAPQNQQHPLAAASGGLLWLVTPEQVEVIDWAKKAVIRQLQKPPDGDVAVAVEGACLIADGNLTAVFPDGESAPLPLDLEKGQPLSYVHAAGNLLCGFGSPTTLVVVEYLPGEKRCAVRFKKNVVPHGYQVSRTFMIPRDDSVMIGLKRFGEEQVEKVLFVSARDGGVLRQGDLAVPADAISYGDDHIWAFKRDTSSMTTYDLDLKLVRGASLPFNLLREIVP